jgi:hypothetical protein
MSFYLYSISIMNEFESKTKNISIRMKFLVNGLSWHEFNIARFSNSTSINWQIIFVDENVLSFIHDDILCTPLIVNLYETIEANLWLSSDMLWDVLGNGTTCLFDNNIRHATSNTQYIWHYDNKYSQDIDQIFWIDSRLVRLAFSHC